MQLPTFAVAPAALLASAGMRTSRAQPAAVVPGTRALTIQESLGFVSTETAEEFRCVVGARVWRDGGMPWERCSAPSLK